MDWMTVGSAAGQFLIDYFAIIVGVFCGALHGVKHKLDVVGVFTLGIVVGYGGGIMRDTLLQNHGFFIMQYPRLFLLCILIGVLVSTFRRPLKRIEPHLFYVDAFSMALYTLAGSIKAWGCGVGPILTIMLGVITAVGGGVLRDICTGETPAVFQSSNFYAVSGIAGSAAFVAAAELGLPVPIPDIACVGVAFGLTVASSHFDWRTSAE